jgi:predicted HTH domain antitoxin
MQDLVLTLPAESLFGAKIPPLELEVELRQRLAVALFSDGIISGAAACRMAGMEKAAFQHLLGERGVKQPYDVEDLEEDLGNWEKWRAD